MAAQAALKAGVGLLTVGIPESLHAAFAAHRPEAMWIPLPETPEGGLALEGQGKVRSLLGRITALAAGPGIGSDPEAHALIRGNYITTTEDLEAVAEPVLYHRIITNFHARSEGITSSEVINRLLEEARKEDR